MGSWSSEIPYFSALRENFSAWATSFFNSPSTPSSPTFDISAPRARNSANSAADQSSGLPISSHHPQTSSFSRNSPLQSHHKNIQSPRDAATTSSPFLKSSGKSNSSDDYLLPVFQALAGEVMYLRVSRRSTWKDLQGAILAKLCLEGEINLVKQGKSTKGGTAGFARAEVGEVGGGDGLGEENAAENEEKRKEMYYCVLENGIPLTVQAQETVNLLPLNEQLRACFAFERIDSLMASLGKDSHSKLQIVYGEKIAALYAEMQKVDFVLPKERKLADQLSSAETEEAFQTFRNNVRMATNLIQESRCIICLSMDLSDRVKIQKKSAIVLISNLLIHSNLVIDWVNLFAQKIEALQTRHSLIVVAYPKALEELKNVKLHPAMRDISRKYLTDCLPMSFVNSFVKESFEDHKKLMEFTEDLLKQLYRLFLKIEDTCSRSVNYVQDQEVSHRLLPMIVQLGVTQKEQFDMLMVQVTSVPITYSNLSIDQRDAMGKAQRSKVTEIDGFNSKIKSTFKEIEALWARSLGTLAEELQLVIVFKKYLNQLHHSAGVWRIFYYKVKESFDLIQKFCGIPSSYASAQAEICRREAFNKSFLELVSFSESCLETMRLDELPKRRDFYRDNAYKLPLGILTGLDVASYPRAKISFL